MIITKAPTVVRSSAVIAVVLVVVLLLGISVPRGSSAQDALPADNGLEGSQYHPAPRYRESESHPFRVLAYIVHPFGWAARELIFRPLSYFASSTEAHRSVMGFREPFDYRQPECFSADDSSPDCHSVAPYKYSNRSRSAEPLGAATVYFPNVNFDFNSRKLNKLGQGKVREIATMLQKEPGVKIVLQGHADYYGSDAYNMKLGMDRAEAVRGELATLGISADQISTVSFGESQPLFAEKEDWARAVNRRVEVRYPEEAAK